MLLQLVPSETLAETQQSVYYRKYSEFKGKLQKVKYYLATKIAVVF
jgi:ribosomal protein L30/L7E